MEKGKEVQNYKMTGGKLKQFATLSSALNSGQQLLLSSDFHGVLWEEKRDSGRI